MATRYGVAKPMIPAKPGPRKGVLPPPLPAGQIPPDDSRLWMFVPKAITAGETWIQDDTREWFEDQDRKVQVRRDYPTHPRWMVGGPGATARGAILNDGIISEVHLLVRITAGLPDVPAWIPARLSLKQSQADLAHRLTKTARGVFIEQGKLAMKDFATRSPGQFLKFIAATFIPKQIEQNVTVTPGQSLDPETADQMIDLLAGELKRREQEAAALVVNPTDYEGGPIADNLQAVADQLAAATGAPEKARIVDAKNMNPQAANRLRHVIDLEADVVDPQTGEIEWD